MHVLVIDDHPIIRLAWRVLLQDVDASVRITDAASFAQGRAALRESAFDLVIAERVLPDAEDGQALFPLLEDSCGVPVVIFTASEQPEHIRAALAAGVRAYLPKSTETQLIATILRLVLAGGVYVPPTLASAPPPTAELTAPVVPDNSPAPLGSPDLPATVARLPSVLPNLTRRQFQVLEYLARGLSNAEISEAMGLNLSTVKSHVTGVLRALNVESRTQAVLIYKQADWGSRASRLTDA